MPETDEIPHPVWIDDIPIAPYYHKPHNAWYLWRKNQYTPNNKKLAHWAANHRRTYAQYAFFNSIHALRGDNHKSYHSEEDARQALYRIKTEVEKIGAHWGITPNYGTISFPGELVDFVPKNGERFNDGIVVIGDSSISARRKSFFKVGDIESTTYHLAKQLSNHLDNQLRIPEAGSKFVIENIEDKWYIIRENIPGTHQSAQTYQLLYARLQDPTKREFPWMIRGSEHKAQSFETELEARTQALKYARALRECISPMRLNSFSADMQTVPRGAAKPGSYKTWHRITFHEYSADDTASDSLEQEEQMNANSSNSSDTDDYDYREDSEDSEDSEDFDTDSTLGILYDIATPALMRGALIAIQREMVEIALPYVRTAMSRFSEIEIKPWQKILGWVSPSIRAKLEIDRQITNLIVSILVPTLLYEAAYRIEWTRKNAAIMGILHSAIDAGFTEAGRLLMEPGLAFAKEHLISLHRAAKEEKDRRKLRAASRNLISSILDGDAESVMEKTKDKVIKLESTATRKR